MSSRRGFTLLEMLISLALVALLLVAMNLFLFSMGEIWGRGGDKRLFDQHVRAVTRYLDRELRTASLPPAMDNGEEAFQPAEIRPGGGMPETLLTFELPEGSRMFSWPEKPLPEVVCALQLREQHGLFLLWHSRLEERFADDSPRELLLSPFATGLSYDYYDPEARRWKNEKNLKKDASDKQLPPRRMRITFSHKGYTRESVIALPLSGEGLPNF